MSRRDQPTLRRLVTAAAISILAALCAPVPVVRAGTTPFTDIAGTTFEHDIEWLWTEGITKGCTATSYCPERPVSRAEMASFLVRMFDLTAGATVDAFIDDDGTTHEADINRLAYAGITTGCSPTRFCPSADMRRDEMATFLVRAIPLSVGGGRDYFYDDNGNTHEADIDRSAAAGITTGCGTWRYCPAASVARGQMAAFLHRVVDPVTPPPYPAPDVRTLHVATTGTDAANDCLAVTTPCGSIAHAISVAADGDTIQLGPGTFHEGNLDLDRDVTVRGDGPASTIVDGTGIKGAVFFVGPASPPIVVTLDSLAISGGHQAGSGGGLLSYGNTQITNVRISGNDATTYGGGVYNGGTMTIAASTITDNAATKGHGGGVWNSTRLTITDSTICRNSAFARGGGIAAESHATTKYLDVRRTLICDNAATDEGGGIDARAIPTSIANSTIAGNEVVRTYWGEDRGGGIAIVSGSLTVLDSTVTANSAGTGGGIFRVADPATHLVLANTLVIANPKGGNVAGSIDSKLTSLVGAPAGLTPADILDPGGLKDNGGPTMTIALTDSGTNPAIDAGDAATCAAAPVDGVDQRGMPRTPPCDIGAYEVQQ